VEETMKQRWDIQEIVATLEEQAEVHREREAHHAELGALHEELRSRPAAELGAITKRLGARRGSGSLQAPLDCGLVEPQPPDEESR
jgi:hypothetical protein